MYVCVKESVHACVCMCVREGIARDQACSIFLGVKVHKVHSSVRECVCMCVCAKESVHVCMCDIMVIAYPPQLAIAYPLFFSQQQSNILQY